jgi:hypothetical protein
MSAKNELSSLKENWRKTLAGVQILTSRSDSSLILHLLLVPASKRNLGYGHEIMQELTTFCDRHNLIFSLVPMDDYGIPMAILQGFYRKHGFQLLADGSMSRQPLYWDEYQQTRETQLAA